MKMVLSILGLLIIGTTTYPTQAMTPVQSSQNQIDSYNTKHFFDKEKEINQGKNIIIQN